MDWRNMRWPVLIGSVLVTFVILLGAFALYRHQTVDSSIVRLYRSYDSVEDVALSTDGPVTTVTVTLGPGANLATVHAQLRATADRVLGPSRYDLVLRDQRGDTVRDAYYQMHFSFREAAATGRFTTMADAVDDIAADSGLTRHRVEIGDDYMYVTLEKDDQYLYEVLKRRKEG